MKNFARFASLALAASLLAAPAFAQQAQKRPQGPTIVKTFNTWGVRCFSETLCDIAEVTTFPQTGQFAASVSVAYVPRADGPQYLVQVILPPGVDLPKGARMVADSYASETMRYHHCDRIGCYAVLERGNTVVGEMKRRGNIGIQMTRFRGKTMNIVVPLAGFKDALNYLVDLVKQRSSGAPQPAAPDAPTDNSTTPNP